MAKGGRGGKRRGGGNGTGSNAPYSKSPNAYQIPDKLSDALGEKGKPMSQVDAFFDANPYFSENYADFSENCQRCVLAYEMRRRGYNVEALPTYENDEMPINGRWAKALSGVETAMVGKSTEKATIKSIEDQMAKWGDGSRAIIRVKWAGGSSGHVFNCENVNGKLQVYDAQSNHRTTGKNLLKEYLPYTTLKHTQLLRTDNADVTDDMRYMVKKK